jgi:hypothetical protein
MEPLKDVRWIPWTAGLLPLFLIFGLLGCSSLQSKSVRTLIDLETERIGAAGKNAGEFVQATNQAIDAWKTSVQALNESLENQKKIESVHSLVFSANQNIATKTGVDAHAAAYLIGGMYLADRMGLEQAVLDQFDQDFKALKKLADQINKSWGALKKTQNEIRTFANQSFVATVDTDLARALVVDFAGDSEMIADTLRRSRQVNEALKKTPGLGLLERQDSGRAPAAIQDLLNLLANIK